MEPKFNVDDIVVGRISGEDYTILYIGEKSYFYRNNKCGYEGCTLIEKMNQEFYIKPKEVKITRKDLAEVWDELALGEHYAGSKDSRLFKKLVNKLGL